MLNTKIKLIVRIQDNHQLILMGTKKLKILDIINIQSRKKKGLKENLEKKN